VGATPTSRFEAFGREVGIAPTRHFHSNQLMLNSYILFCIVDRGYRFCRLFVYVFYRNGSYTIWLPRADRGRVLKVWHAQPGEMVDDLPLGYDATTMKTIEQIDVIWLRNRSIVRAFEVEHTTSVYSGLLRMADLVALQPNINIKLHIVAPAEKREKVLQEIQRPVFSLLEGRALAEMCTYLSYDNVIEISELKHLAHLSDKVIEEYEESAE